MGAMTGHTKGPWHFREEDWLIIAKIGPSLTDNMHIAQVRPQGRETMANAALLAAAPALKEALEAALPWLQMVSQGSGPNNPEVRALNSARAALRLVDMGE